MHPLQALALAAAHAQMGGGTMQPGDPGWYPMLNKMRRRGVPSVPPTVTIAPGDPVTPVDGKLAVPPEIPSGFPGPTQIPPVDPTGALLAGFWRGLPGHPEGDDGISKRR